MYKSRTYHRSPESKPPSETPEPRGGSGRDAVHVRKVSMVFTLSPIRSQTRGNRRTSINKLVQKSLSLFYISSRLNSILYREAKLDINIHAALT